MDRLQNLIYELQIIEQDFHNSKRYPRNVVRCDLERFRNIRAEIAGYMQDNYRGGIYPSVLNSNNYKRLAYAWRDKMSISVTEFNISAVDLNHKELCHFLNILGNRKCIYTTEGNCLDKYERYYCMFSCFDRKDKKYDYGMILYNINHYEYAFVNRHIRNILDDLLLLIEEKDKMQNYNKHIKHVLEKLDDNKKEDLSRIITNKKYSEIYEIALTNNIDIWQTVYYERKKR